MNHIFKDKNNEIHEFHFYYDELADEDIILYESPRDNYEFWISRIKNKTSLLFDLPIDSEIISYIIKLVELQVFL